MEVSSMSDNEVKTMGLLKDLVEMTEENFQRCVEYAENMEASENVKSFLYTLLKVALIKREKTIQTA